MPLNKTALKNDIKQLLQDMMSRENTSMDEFATRLSDTVDTYVKGATIVYQNGLIAPSGSVTGFFNGQLQ